jgi:hypothetical protein
MQELIAWIVVLSGGLGLLAAVFVATRRIASSSLRSVTRCLAAVWLMLPYRVPVPADVIDASYAPAFVIVMFEAVFRRDGNPGPALTALGIASLVVIAIVLGVAAFRWQRTRDAAPESASD